MATATKANLKSRFEQWAEIPTENFDALTFDDLSLGEKFIPFPMPRDNNGHGGFMGTSFIFRKLQERVKGANGNPDLPYHKDHPHGRAVNEHLKTWEDIPHDMPVLRVM